MTKPIKLGNEKNKQNHILVKDDSVSANHLEIEWQDGKTLFIKDLGSRNYTLVNERRIKTAVIKATDKIEVGYTTYTGAELIQQTQKILNQKKVIFYDEFKALEPKFEAYKKALKKIKTVYRNKTNLMRYGIPLMLLILFLAFGESWSIPSKYRLIIPIVGGIIYTFFVEQFFNQEDLNEQVKHLEEKYQRELVCPKCGQRSLIQQSYNYWAQQRKCDHCAANWVK